jgi:hypothetical protein
MNELLNWIPEKFIRAEDQQMIRWLYTGAQPYTDPFFDETITRCRALSPNLRSCKVISTSQWLIEQAKGTNSVYPSAFIFHVSRCGSTLLSQLLGLIPGNIVLAEVPFLDAILQNGTNEDHTKDLLPAALAFYGQKRKGNETHLFIKTDSWHLHSLPLIRKFYPGVPFFILCREPGAVLRSHLKKKGMQAVPGLLDPSIFGLEKAFVTTLHPDKYMEVVLEGYYRKALEYHEHTNTHLLCYEDGIPGIVKTICRLTGMHPGEGNELAMRQRMNYHSKDAAQAFTGDMLRADIHLNSELAKLYDAIRESAKVLELS